MINLLSKGLNFCPTPGLPDRYALRQDLDKFHTSLRRKCFFDRSAPVPPELDSTAPTLPAVADNDEEPFAHHKFKNRSSWSPIGPHQLETFITVNEHFLNEHPLHAPPRQNLQSDEQKALAELLRATNIIIKPADKGSAVVIQDIQDYIDEGLRQLSDINFYVETPIDLTHKHNELISNLIKYLHQSEQISDKCRDYLINSSPRTPQLYLLPKIHKNKKPVPGRPIVSANNSPTERISQLADHFLQPLVPKTKSYIRDTSDFLYHLDNIPTLSKNSLLCTVDVTSLYTNIPNDEGIQACMNMLNSHRTDNSSLSNQSIKNLLEYTLHMNNFDFNGRHFLQTGGTAMGTKVAPSFANLFMAYFEETHVYTHHTPPRVWYRFIDDIFMIWENGQDTLNEFLNHLNNCHNTIKFTWDTSPTSVVFLDTKVLIDENHRLYTTLYCKPTDSHSYLLYSSHHPMHLKNSLPYSQLLRVRRICSRQTDFDQNALMICSHFIKRGYPLEIVQTALLKARRLDRKTLLAPKPSIEPNFGDPKSPFFLISTFSDGTDSLKNIVKKTWPLLGRTNTTEFLFENRVIFGKRRNKNLRDTLVHAKIPEPPPDPAQASRRAFNRKCKAQQCRYCPKLNTSGHLFCHKTGRKHTTKTQITCNSNNLIYCIECTRCHKLYVGQTKNSIKERFKAHFYSIQNPQNSDTVVGRHFSSTNHKCLDDVLIHVLEFIHPGSKSPASQRIRDEVERKWIHMLTSTAPFGLNSAD
jgi:hypothetical protein